MRIAIGIPTTGDISIETTMALLYALQQTKHEFVLCFHKGTYVQELRNDIVRDAREHKADYLMFIDTDMIFQPDGINILLSREKDIIGAAYNMKSEPPVTTIKIADENGNRLAQKDFEFPKEPFKCYSIPTGFMLIRLDAIKDMKYPFEFDREADGQIIGEDVNFCIQARKKGIDVWCEPTVKVGHLGQKVY